MVKSKGAYSPQYFVCAVTGKCYTFRSDTISGLADEIRSRLSENGYCLRDYPLPEIGQVAEDGADVVLVELTGEDEAGNWITVYHWFEVPEAFREEESE